MRNSRISTSYKTVVLLSNITWHITIALYKRRVIAWRFWHVVGVCSWVKKNPSSPISAALVGRLGGRMHRWVSEGKEWVYLLRGGLLPMKIWNTVLIHFPFHSLMISAIGFQLPEQRFSMQKVLFDVFKVESVRLTRGYRMNWHLVCINEVHGLLVVPHRLFQISRYHCLPAHLGPEQRFTAVAAKLHSQSIFTNFQNE